MLGSFGLLVAVGLALWLPEAGVSHDTADSDLGAALLSGALVALVVFLTSQQSQAEETRRALAESLAARFTAPEFLERLEATAAFLSERASESEESRAAAWLRLAPPEQLRLIAPLNDFELVGAAYKNRDASRTILYNHFQDVAPALWNRAGWLVALLRVRRHPHLFYNWEWMVADFHRIGARRGSLEAYEPHTTPPAVT